MDVESVRRPALRIVAWTACWTLVALFSALRISLDTVYAGRELDWSGAVIRGAAHVFPWALWTPAVLWLTRRFLLVRGKWPPRLALHLAVGILLSAINLVASTTALSWVGGRAQTLTLLELQLNFLVYWALVGAAHALHYARRFRERELRTSRLEAELTQARLNLLRAQLQPHFLFNTLNAVSELIHEDTVRAEQMVADLSQLLRRALDAGSSDGVTLAVELDLLDCYLAIEKTRFEESLDVVVDVASEARVAIVPYLILQPIVENAVKFSMKNNAGVGRVEVRADLEDGDLLLEVADNGPGFAGDCSEPTGIGLRNTCERLEQRYGKRQQLIVGTGPGGGGHVTIRIPFERAGGLR